MLKLLAVIALLAVGVGATVFAVMGNGSAATATSQYLSATAAVGTVAKTAVATGNVSVATQYGLAFGSLPAFVTSSTTSSSGSGSGAGGSSSYLVASVNVVPGDTVTAGQVLASADTGQLQLAVDTAQANLLAAKSKLDTDKGGPTADVKAAAQDSITQAQLAAQQAQQGVATAAASNNLSVSQAQLQLANAQRQYATDLKGPDSGTLAAAKDSITSAQLGLKTAQQNLVNTKSSDDQSIQAAEDAVTTAQQAVTDTAASNTLALQTAQAALTTAQQNDADTKAKNDASIAAAQNNFDVANAQFIADANPPGGKPDQSKVAQDQAAIDQAQTALTNAQLNADSALHSAQNQVDTAQTNLTNAQLKADEATRTAETAVTNAQAAVTTARQKAAQAEQSARNQVLSAQNALTAAQHSYDLKTQPSSVTLANDQQAIASAQLSLRNAQLNAQKAVQSATNQVQQAAQSVTAAKHGYDTKVAPATASQIATDQAAVATAQNTLDTAQKTLDMAQITSPVAGTVVAVNIAASSIAPSGYAITVQSSDLQVIADFTESDLPSLALKQTATVTVTAAGATVQGTVRLIAPQAVSGTTGGVVTYAVTIALIDPPANVRVGMSAQASVTTAQAADVLTIPSVALRGANGNYSVQVLDASGQPQTVAVTVGLVSNGLAEIQSGLTEGERVVTGTVSARQGTTTTGGGFGGGGIAIPGGIGGGGGFGGRGGAGGNRGTGGGATAP